MLADQGIIFATGVLCVAKGVRVLSNADQFRSHGFSTLSRGSSEPRLVAECRDNK